MNLRRWCLWWLLTASSVAFAQEMNSDFSLSILSNIPRHSSGSNHGSVVSVDSTIAGGFAANYRRNIGSRYGVELGYSYTRGMFYYNDDETATNGGIIFHNQGSNIHDLSGAFVYRYNRSFHRIQPFALGGGGVVIFRPTSSSSNTLVAATTQARGMYLYGGGADYPLKGRLTVRAEFRVVNYIKAPDFFGTGLKTYGRMGNFVPQLGIAYHF